MLLLAEEILAKKVPFVDVALLIFYSLPAIIALSFPFAALVGCLMAVGKFASSNEIIAFQASGISLKKIFVPVFGIGLLFAGTSFIMNDYFLPIGTLNFGRLYRKLLYSHPELEIEGYSVKNFQDSIITTGKVGPEGIEGLLIIDKEPEGNKRVITAKTARIDKDREGVIGLVLDGVFIHSLHKKEKDRFSYSFAEIMVYNILLKNISLAFRSPGPREMSSVDVFKEIQKKRIILEARRMDSIKKLYSLEHEYVQTYNLLVERLFSGEITLENGKENLTRLAEQIKTERARDFQDRSLQIHLIEFYKKFSIPFSCIPFVIFAFPVGLFTRRSGWSVGFGIGLFVSIFYWGMLVAGQTLGIRADLSPLLSMWVPNLVIMVLGIGAFIMRFTR
jgi:lipopolysaccharide export system permease protein